MKCLSLNHHSRTHVLFMKRPKVPSQIILQLLTSSLMSNLMMHFDKILKFHWILVMHLDKILKFHRILPWTEHLSCVVSTMDGVKR